MASTLRPAANGSRIRDKIFKKIDWKRGALGAIARKAKWQSAGTPSVETSDYLTYPAKVGDLAWDTTNSYAYICSVKPTITTAATFVKMHA